MSAATPANRAALAMFVVTEVHPFTDGNGRTQRPEDAQLTFDDSQLAVVPEEGSLG